MGADTIGSQTVPLYYRQIRRNDIPALFAVRTATRENRFTLGELRTAGITEKSVAAMLEETHSGWLCEEEGRALGFAMADESTGELWVIAVLPEAEGRGIGTELLRRGEERLREVGHGVLWLYTSVDPALRAYGFYLTHGWAEAGVENGELRMEKRLQ